MPNKTKCATELPCNPPADNSEVCYKVRCEPKCLQNCCIPDCPCYRPDEIVCLYKDAVVEVHSEFILLGEDFQANGANSGATGGTPLSPNVRDDVILEGNGFFIKGHYIVAPAQLVLMPPSLTSVANRYPYLFPDDTSLGNIKNQIIRASRILVSVFNVNGKGHSFVYEADLVGVDGAGDIAVLRINYKKQWNMCNPCVEKCHPYFNFGSSRGSKDGEIVYLIGDYITDPNNRRLFSGVGLVSAGLLSDHRHVDYSGSALFESVVVSAPAFAFSAGLPILNCQGQVIGMQTTDLAAVLPRLALPNITANFSSTGTTGGITGTIIITGGSFLNQQEGLGLVSGPSEFFMRRIIRAIINGTCSRRFNCQLETICDPVGSYYRYRKGYLGLAYDIFTGVDYDITVDYTSGVTGAGFPRVRLTSPPNGFGDFLNSPSCKELVGVRVLGLAGLNPNDDINVQNGFWFVPGGTISTVILADHLPVSPFLGKLQPGDVITHIDGVALGDLNKQIAPSLITWRTCAGDQLEVCYRRGGNALNNNDNSLTENYDNLFTHVVCLADFPYLLDYPWYAVNIFPLLSDLGWNFPFGQIINPQFPALDTGGIFHPAL